jgi:hypothetical protein
LLGVVCYGSNILATIFAVLIVKQSLDKYKELFDKFKTGKTNYQGSELLEDLQNSHATVTFFPAQVAFSIMFGWLTGFLLSVILLSLISIVLIYWEWAIATLGPYVLYYTVYLGSFFFFKNIVIEQILVAPGTGEIIYPRIFSCLWIIFIVYNFIFGISLAIFRIGYMLVYALLSSCFLHYSIFPSDQLAFDPGYYCLLTAAYTAYERANPIKNAFISVLMPLTRTRWGPPRDDEYADQEHAKQSESYRRLRARNRFNLALTLWRNPKVSGFRHPHKPGKADDTCCCTTLCHPDLEEDGEEIHEDAPLVKSVHTSRETSLEDDFM